MNQIVKIQKKEQLPLPSCFQEDGRFDIGLLEYLIERYTEKGQIICDPFAGYGTTGLIAEKMDRKFVLLEKYRPKYEYMKKLLHNSRNCIELACCDLRNYNCSLKADCIITSPTYCWKNLGFNPLKENTGDTYIDYLDDIFTCFVKITDFVKKDGYIIIDSSNILYKHIYTTLAWDIEHKLRLNTQLKFQYEIIIDWDGEEGFLGGKYGFGQDYSYILVYKKIN